MIQYWVDADSLIKPYHEAYQFNLVPQFWEYLEAQAKARVIASTDFVLLELEHGGKSKGEADELLLWARRLKGTLFLSADSSVQAVFKQVVNYVQGNPQYGQQWIQPFINGSDPWLIAQAKALGGIVVTFETSVPPQSNKPKIPDVAAQFGVQCVDLWKMLTVLKARF